MSAGWRPSANARVFVDGCRRRSIALDLPTMTKGTTNRASSTAFVLLALGCGGRAENQVSAGAGGSDAASGAPSIAVAGSGAGGSPSVEVGGAAGAGAGGSPPAVGPIDTTGLPTELPIDCAGVTSPPHLALPCKIGGPIGGGSVLECYAPGGETAVPNGQDRPVLSILIPFASLPTMLNRPIQLSSFPPGPPPGSDGLTGTVVFTQVDPVGRAFVGRLIGGKLDGCTIPITPFWAVKGNFQ